VFSSVDVAEHFTHKRDRRSMLERFLSVENDGWFVLACARNYPDNFLIIRGYAWSQSTVCVADYDSSGFRRSVNCDIEIFRAVGIDQPNVSGYLDVTVEAPRHLPSAEDTGPIFTEPSYSCAGSVVLTENTAVSSTVC
jgi:hypothetical protein